MKKHFLLLLVLFLFSVKGFCGSVAVKEDDCYILYENCVVKDKSAGLLWLCGPDRDMDWNAVCKFSEQPVFKKNGWRLPSIEEIKSLYKKTRGARGLSPFFKTEGWWIWSAEEVEEKAWGFTLYEGKERLDIKGITPGSRVFLVKKADNPKNIDFCRELVFVSPEEVEKEKIKEQSESAQNSQVVKAPEKEKNDVEEKENRTPEIEQIPEKDDEKLEKLETSIAMYKKSRDLSRDRKTGKNAWQEVVQDFPEACLVQEGDTDLLYKVVTQGLKMETDIPADGREFTNSIGMKFVYILPGIFRMGNPIDTRNDISHVVILTRGFYMQSTEVTQGQWEKVMGNNPSKFKMWFGRSNDLPVEKVSWKDTQEFIKKLNEIEKTDKYRLPTEAEWEYASRAGSTGAYCFGENKKLLDQYAWYKGVFVNSTSAVAQKQPNSWGLHDMHGNVWEWVQDKCRENNRVETDTYVDGIIDPICR